MIWYEIILLVVFIISFSLIIIRLFIKFPLAARIDLKNLPKEKQQTIKKKIVDQRLRRIFKEKTSDLWKKIFPFLKKINKKIVHWYKIIIAKEKALKINKLRKKAKELSRQDLLKEKIENALINAKDYFKQDDLSQAEKEYLEVISLDNKNIEAFEGLSIIYLKQKKYKEAKEIYKYLLKLSNYNKEKGTSGLNNQNAGYLFALSEIYKIEENFDLANEHLIAALNIEPNNPKYLDALLDLSIIRKDKFLAIDVLMKLKNVNPDNNKLVEFEEQIEKL